LTGSISQEFQGTGTGSLAIRLYCSSY
jgi:hypothetical protein